MSDKFEQSNASSPKAQRPRRATAELSASRLGDRVRREYSRLAARYDRRWAHYVAVTTRETVGQLNLKEDDRVLDVGCGTGVLLETLAKRIPGEQLVGLDPVAEMMNVARERLDHSVRLVQGTAEALPFDSNAFDIVVSNSALHYFTDPKAAIQEMYRVLRPGGQVVLTDWRRDHWATPFIRYYLNARSHTYGRVFSQDELGALLTLIGFERVEVSCFSAGWCWGLITVDAIKREQET